MGETIEFLRPDGKRAPGYYAPAPQPQTAPGIVLFEEWWGLDDRIKATADRLASHEFNVVVPDLYRGRSAATGDEANHLMQGLDFADAATQDAGGAAAFLRERGSRRVGVMGFCMGGALAMLGVMHGREFDAASTWYGFPPPDAGEPSHIRVPIQGHWARDDDHFTIEGVDAIERKLKAGDVPYEFYRYDAKHGFFNQGEPGKGGLGHYHPEHAETAWRHTIEFFNRNLR
jgi:carboxymethylenebutenolidase